MSEPDYSKQVEDMTEEEFAAWMAQPYDPNDPRLSYDPEAWAETAALLEERKTLEELARHNANSPGPLPLQDPDNPYKIGSFAQERMERERRQHAEHNTFDHEAQPDTDQSRDEGDEA
jgi:hypothetical protein